MRRSSGDANSDAAFPNDLRARRDSSQNYAWRPASEAQCAIFLQRFSSVDAFLACQIVYVLAELDSAKLA
jgi:hypothetical protein